MTGAVAVSGGAALTKSDPLKIPCADGGFGAGGDCAPVGGGWSTQCNYFLDPSFWLLIAIAIAATWLTGLAKKRFFRKPPPPAPKIPDKQKLLDAVDKLFEDAATNAETYESKHVIKVVGQLRAKAKGAIEAAFK